MGSWSIYENKEILSRYEILGHIGSGSYSDVYKARSRLDNTRVALKEVHDYQSAYREIEALLRLRGHPHIVFLIEYLWLDDDDAVLVLEYLPLDLASVIKEGQDRKPFKGLTEVEVKSWMRQLLEGVCGCHLAGVLHRDLKPSNLLISACGVLKVADFGQARIIDDESCNHAFLGLERMECSLEHDGSQLKACDMIDQCSSGNLLTEEHSERISGISEEAPSAGNSPVKGFWSFPSSALLVAEKLEDLDEVEVTNKGLKNHPILVGSQLNASELQDPLHEDIPSYDAYTPLTDLCLHTQDNVACEESEEQHFSLVGTYLDDDISPRYEDADLLLSNQENEQSRSKKSSAQCDVAIEGMSKKSTELLSHPQSYSKEEFTGCVGTRWYRSPELLYGAAMYGTEIDMWAVGCLFGELLLGHPVFKGGSDIDQLSRIVGTLGNPTEENWPSVSELPNYGKISFMDQTGYVSLRNIIPQGSKEAHDLLNKLIKLDPAARLTALEALDHSFFLMQPVALPSCELKLPAPNVSNENHSLNS